jgi:hypothetical protein
MEIYHALRFLLEIVGIFRMFGGGAWYFFRDFVIAEKVVV